MLRSFAKPLRSPRWWLVFTLAGLLFMGFGVVSFNLFHLLQANLALFAEHGLMVVADGALQQLLELLAMGYLSLLLWIGFKACEAWLVARALGAGRRP
ncbi:MAG: hypothetical protein KDG55_00870 [Rhodocyclaceae bacterium]|nr:hypothetical protein [Rhodocyclaceae bacterium]